MEAAAADRVKKRPSWEHVWAGFNSTLYRTKVPGGWLLRLQGVGARDAAALGGITFYPDSKHEWDGSSLE